MTTASYTPSYRQLRVGFLLLLTLSLASIGSAINLYLSSNGSDSSSCSSASSACRSLGRIMRDVRHNDVIIVMVNPSDDTNGCNWLCYENDVVHISTSVSLVGLTATDGIAASLCSPRSAANTDSDNEDRQHPSTGSVSQRLTVFNITGRGPEPSDLVHLTVENLTIFNALFFVRNGHLSIVNAIVIDTKMTSSLPPLPPTSDEAEQSQVDGGPEAESTESEEEDDGTKSHASQYVGLDLRKSVWKTLINVNENNTREVDVSSSGVVNVTIFNSTVYRTPMSFSGGSVLFNASDSKFDGIYDALPSVHAIVNLVIEKSSQYSHIIVNRSLFQRQINENPVESVINLSDGALSVMNHEEGPREAESNVTVHIESSQFINNERGFGILGLYQRVSVIDCSFDGNIAMHAGAAVLVHVDERTPRVEIKRCTFRHNAAGHFRRHQVANFTEQFTVKGDEVWVNGDRYKGVIALVGKGGAIRIQSGRVSLVDCVFENNTSRLLGGALFVDREASVSTDRVTMINSDSDSHALEGDLMYSIGNVTVRRTRLLVSTASNHVSILCHSGARWSMETVSIEVQCPVGFRLRTSNASIYGIQEDGLMRSYKMDQLSYFCESCPRNKYSLDYGYLNYSTHHSSEAFYTLLVNGTFPNLPSRVDLYNYTDIRCHQCPYGGKCLHGIGAVPNFWGYKIRSGTVGALDRVRFQRCQRGYCSTPGSDCHGIDCCRHDRIGVLCGECRPGYSEAMFTSDCMPNEWCDPTIGWPVMLTSGILYFIFLLFQKNVRELMFSNFQPISAFRRAVNTSRRSTMASFNGIRAASARRRVSRQRSSTSTGQPAVVIIGEEINGLNGGDKQHLEVVGFSSTENIRQQKTSSVELVHPSQRPPSRLGREVVAVVDEKTTLNQSKASSKMSFPIGEVSPRTDRTDELTTKVATPSTLCGDFGLPDDVINDDEDVGKQLSADVDASASESFHVWRQKNDEDDEVAALPPPPTYNETVVVSGAASGSEPKKSSDMGVSFLIIVFFYFQDAQLLHIKTVFASNENKSLVMFREFLSGLFKFRIEIFQFMDKFCFLADLTPVKKLIVRVVLVPYVLLQFGLAHLIYRWYTRSVCQTKGEKREAVANDAASSRCHGGAKGGRRQVGATGSGSGTFAINLSTGFVLALLFTYQKLATASLTLLNCVPVGNRTVLFIQGTIDCYQTWQLMVAVYAATCIVPFCFAILLGPGLIRDGLINLAELFVACLVPLPFLIRWIWLRYCHRRDNAGLAQGPVRPVLAPDTLAVIQILQGPFKDSSVPFFGPICGQGLLLGRRLILVLLYTFVNDTLLRMVCIMLLCFVILLHHVHVLPYKDSRGNAAGSGSAASLLVVGAINLLRAGFEAAEYVPLGPNERLMDALEQVENVLLLWMPAAVMGFVVATLLLKLTLLGVQSACSRFHSRRQNSRRSSPVGR